MIHTYIHREPSSNQKCCSSYIFSFHERSLTESYYILRRNIQERFVPGSTELSGFEYESIASFYVLEYDWIEVVIT
jgi:hypothetical protein